MLTSAKFLKKSLFLHVDLCVFRKEICIKFKTIARKPFKETFTFCSLNKKAYRSQILLEECEKDLFSERLALKLEQQI